jgi:hypothetical protein
MATEPGAWRQFVRSWRVLRRETTLQRRICLYLAMRDALR